MSDQMPDEVWLYHPSRVDRDDVIGSKWTAYETDVGEAETHYIRADLYEQVEAKRDRLRAALERLMRGEGGVNSLEQGRIAQEALDHDRR